MYSKNLTRKILKEVEEINSNGNIRKVMRKVEEEVSEIPQLTESKDNILIELKQTQDKKEDPNIEKPKTIVIEVFNIATPTVEWHNLIACS